MANFAGWQLHPDKKEIWLDPEHRVTIRAEALSPTEAVAVLRFIADHCTKQHTNSGRGTRIVLAEKKKAPIHAGATADEGDRPDPTTTKETSNEHHHGTYHRG
ncbi:hypothetical protein [Rathayibacter caricis]|uniref:hypothetical protein n=1 Tax=Rathayibacter caricis TaxID=110936 RepID=UPI0011B27083|nr:hypothetical protein [Rathayibacter caricis]